MTDIGRLLVQSYRDQLSSYIQQLGCPADLVLEKELSPLLDLVAPVQFLKSNNMIAKIFYLEPEMNMGDDKRLYIIRSTEANITFINSHIKSDQEQGINRKYMILFTPTSSYFSNELLENFGLLEFVTVNEWNCELIPLDNDLLSMESEYLFYEQLVHKSSVALRGVARSLQILSSLNSWAKTIHTIGEIAKRAYELFLTLQKHSPIIQTSSNSTVLLNNNNDFTDIIMIDREVDMITPICTQLSYEGLLDDVIGISYGAVQLDEKLTGKDKPVKLMLNSLDPTYCDVKGQHISLLFSYIKDKWKMLTNKYYKGRSEDTITGMKSFVKELKVLKPMEQSLVMHLCACEAIRDYRIEQANVKLLNIEQALLCREQLDEKELINFLEEQLFRQANWRDILRLLSLYSVSACSNLKDRAKNIKSLKIQFIRAYGSSHFTTLHNMEQFGFLHSLPIPSQSGPSISSRIQAVSKKYNLILTQKEVDSADLSHPKDTSFVFGGAYKPLIPSMIEDFIRTGTWKTAREVFSNEFVEIFSHKLTESPQKPPSATPYKKSILVYFTSGCSFSEINALRFLSKHLSINIQIATTCIINCNTLFNCCYNHII